MPKNIALIVGSLRKDSVNRKVACGLISLQPESLSMKIIDIGHLPLYNQDYDDDSPSAYVEFREQIRAVDGIIFVTPEHNRSMPAAMKNALDIGSRPRGQSVWNQKIGAVISASPSLQGGFGANHHLRQSLSCLNVYCMQQPEMYLSQAYSLFDEAGAPTPRCTEFLQRFIDGYADWVLKF